MVGIVFHWDLANIIKESTGAIKKMLGIFALTAKSFGVKSVYVIATEEPMPFQVDSEMDFQIFDSLDQIRELGIPLVFVDQRGNPMADFTHPEECLYVFGPDYGGGPVYNEEDENTIISINCDNPYLYAHVAAGIVLHDRFTR